MLNERIPSDGINSASGHRGGSSKDKNVTKQPKKRSQLSPLQQRIRDAERRNSPIGTERVGIDEEGYEMVAVLCERGFGKKVEVLRQALASGLRAMKGASDPDTEPAPQVESELMYEYRQNNALYDSIGRTISVPMATTPITTPPSQQRLLEETEEGNDENQD